MPELGNGKYKMSHTCVYGGEEKALTVKGQLISTEGTKELGNHEWLLKLVGENLMRNRIFT